MRIHQFESIREYIYMSGLHAFHEWRCALCGKSVLLDEEDLAYYPTKLAKCRKGREIGFWETLKARFSANVDCRATDSLREEAAS